MYLLQPRLRYLTFFVSAYMLAGFGYALLSGNLEFVFYAVAVAAQICILITMDRRVMFGQLVLWGMALWGLLHFMGGVLPIPESLTEPGRPANLYNLRLFPWFPKYDQLVHAFGFGMCVLLVYEALCARQQRALKLDISLAAVLFCCAMGLGAINEVIEFTAVLLMPDTNVGGYENTGWDLVSNGVGAMLALFYLKREMRLVPRSGH